MTAVLQIQPKDPAAPSTLSLAGRRAAAERRPVRAVSLVVALAVGAVVGVLISMQAAGGLATDVPGSNIQTDVAAP